MEMFIICFLGLSIILYVLFAGADFGAGIIELSAPREFRDDLNKVTYRAIGPVWEANHIWLIVSLVILFVGFPRVYTTLSIYLHIPLTLMLFGIVARGCAFAFRHYDAVVDNSQKYYSMLFRYSSVFTPFFLGVILGATIYGRIETGAINRDFLSTYLAPWNNLFCYLVGALVCAICAFLAASYFIGESKSETHRAFFSKRALQANVCAIVIGIAVLVHGRVEGIAMLQPISGALLFFVLLAGVAFLVFLLMLRRQSVWGLRLSSAAQIVFVVLGWMTSQYPKMVIINRNEALDIQNTLAPQASTHTLGIALMVASLLVIPALAALLRVFKQ